MTTDQSTCDQHSWRAFTEDEVKTLRSQTRAGRPSGAWVENAEQCEKCGRVEAIVSWWGQVHRVAYAPKTEGGTAVIQWPTRANPGGVGGMGMGQ